MSRRNDKGQFAKPPSKAKITSVWILSLLSIALLWATAKMVVVNFGSFRSCNSNTSVIYINNCGKQSLNSGDFIILGLFILSVGLTASLFTHAWRQTRKAMP